MSAYSISIHIAPGTVRGRRDEQRRGALADTLAELAAIRSWQPSESFAVFKSDASIDEIAAACRQAIEPSRDLVLLLDVHMRHGRIVGHNEDPSVLDLIPFLVEA